MVKKKNESGNWMDALCQLKQIIQTDYKNGGKLPPVPEMAKRFGVAENTYCKALRVLCQHGLARASQGRAGTIIRPEKARLIKIGIPKEDANPLLPIYPITFLLKQLSFHEYGFQLLQESNPDALKKQLLILNISALFIVNPNPVYFPLYSELYKKNFPLAIVEFYTYEIIEKAMKFGLPYFHTDPKKVAREVFQFADRIHAENVLQIDRKPTILTRAFAEEATMSGRIFKENHFFPFGKIETGLAARIKRQKIELIYAKCNDLHAEAICEQILTLPEEKRPAVLFSKEVKHYLNQNRIQGVPIAGYFDLDSPSYQLAARNLAEAILEKRPIKNELNQEFRIDPVSSRFGLIKRSSS